MVNIILIIFLFICAVVGHEMAHVWLAIDQGFKVKKLYFGIPLEFRLFGINWTTNIFKKRINDVEYGISLLLLGGAVDFHNLEKAPFWNFFLVVIAGPIANLLFGFLPLLLYYDFGTSLYITTVILKVVISSLGLFVVGRLPVAQISGPVGAVVTMANFAASNSHGLLLVWIVLNLAFFITNILPIPAIDGGQILTNGLVAIFGEKWRKPTESLTRISWYLLMIFMAIVMTKDLW